MQTKTNNTESPPKTIKQAFTLAETLITLTIIGVVAALTIPSLIAQNRKKEYVTSLQKNYNTLSQVISMSQAHNGVLTNWEWPTAATSEADLEKIMDTYLRPYLNIAIDCKTEVGKGRCWPKGTMYKYLNGANRSIEEDNSTPAYKFTLADASIWSFWVNANCVNTKTTCMEFRMDINGKKGPNMMGRDYFKFWVFPFTNQVFIDGLYTNIYDENTKSWKPNTQETIDASCKITDWGSACGAKIVLDGWKMNY